MIVIKLTQNNGREVILLGLTRENVRRLCAGQPIIVSEETNVPQKNFLPPNTDIHLVYADNEKEFFRLFKEAGLITESTPITVDPRLQDDL
jgi:hypothetical protein